MTEQIQTDWVAWFEKDENGIITRNGVDNDKSAEQYNVCVTTSLEDIDSRVQTLKIEDPEVYNRVVIQDTNLIAAAPKLRQSLESLLNAVRRTDESDDRAWPERDAAMEEAEALLTSLKARN
jgi:hypothetical protein